MDWFCLKQKGTFVDDTGAEIKVTRDVQEQAQASMLFGTDAAAESCAVSVSHTHGEHELTLLHG